MKQRRIKKTLTKIHEDHVLKIFRRKL